MLQLSVTSVGASARSRVGAIGAILVLVLSVACRAAETPQSHRADVPAAHEPALLVAMKLNAYLLHKLALSIEARNDALAAFYAEELEEALEDIRANVPSYESHDIAGLTGAMVLPAIAGVRAQLEAGEWAGVSAGLAAVTAACNQCHVATDHGFIVVTSGVGHNPFNQQFDP